VVFSYSLDREEVVEAQIVKCHSREVDEIYELHIGEAVVCTTSEHPFYVVGKGWVKVAALNRGDLLLTKDKKKIELGEIVRVPRRSHVYNLSVAGNENFFVGMNQVLVHNKPAW
jgi:hypothetical protein